MTPPRPPDHDQHVANPHDDGNGNANANGDGDGSDRLQWQANPAAGVRTGCTPETVCGRSDQKHGPVGCGPHGDNLESFAGNYQKLSVTKLSWGANPGELRLFDLDPAESAAYQRTVTVSSGVDRYCCYSHCTPQRPAAKIPVAPTGMQLSVNCVAAPVSVSNPARDNRDCPATQGQDPYVHGTDAQCCFASFVPTPPPIDPNQQRHYRGRAARVDGDVVVAPVRTGDNARPTWTNEVQPRVAHLDPETRATLRDAWLEAAQMEHASIAAFSALSLRLIALGAPADLIARVHAAALDEIRHAQIAFALASAYADAPVEPAHFTDVARLATTSTLAELAIETFLDGCIEETAAAVDASLAATKAEDPAVASTLRSIADDETRHAELAWAIVAWCVRVDPSIGPLLHPRLAEQLTLSEQLSDDTTSTTPNALTEHGVRSPAESARTRASVLREIVAPCLAALIA